MHNSQIIIHQNLTTYTNQVAHIINRSDPKLIFYFLTVLRVPLLAPTLVLIPF